MKSMGYKEARNEGKMPKTTDTAGDTQSGKELLQEAIREVDACIALGAAVAQLDELHAKLREYREWLAKELGQWLDRDQANVIDLTGPRKVGPPEVLMPAWDKLNELFPELASEQKEGT